MGEKRTWQEAAVEGLRSLFEEEKHVRALVLAGSMASAEVATDEWSDVDLKIILADARVDHYYSSTAWLAGIGDVVAEDRVEHGCTKTLRVCLDGFRRLDLTFIPESELTHRPEGKSVSSWVYDPFHGGHAVVWTDLPDLDGLIAAIPPSPAFRDTAQEELPPIAEGFWFKATIVVAKLVRNDLLVALHLALDLVRDCLVLQMLLRHRAKRTNIHREGGYGNELAAELCTGSRGYSLVEILDIVERACTHFDRLASLLSGDYAPRSARLAPAIRRARAFCMRRAEDEVAGPEDG